MREKYGVTVGASRAWRFRSKRTHKNAMKKAARRAIRRAAKKFIQMGGEGCFSPRPWLTRRDVI